MRYPGPNSRWFRLSLPLVVLACCILARAGEPPAPATLNERFLNAIALRDSGRLFQAIGILEQLLNTSPQLDRARLELAVAYYRAALFEKARRAAERVLRASGTPEPVKDSIQLFLAEVAAARQAARKNRHHLSGVITAGLGHDDNLNIGPNNRVIDIGGTPLTLAPGSAPQSDLFGLMSAQFNHRYRIPGTLNLAGEPVQALWQSAAAFYRKQYETENDFHIDVITISSGPALLSRADWWARINLQLDYIRLGDEPLGVYSTLSPSCTLLRGDNEIRLRAGWLHRRFSRRANKGMDGDRLSLGAEWMRPLDSRWTGRLGIGLYRQDARDARESYHARELTGGLSWRGWKEGALYTRLSHTRNDYAGDEPLFARARHERRNRIELGINHDFRGGEWAHWGLNAQILYTENRSNIDLYDYDRTILLIQTSRRF